MSSLRPFVWSNNTQVAFGVGAISNISRFISSGTRVLCLSGTSDYIVKNGVKQDLEKTLSDCHAVYRWRSGIERNPDYSTCLKIIEDCRKYPVDYIIPVGGGSVMDASKFIASCVHLPSSASPWETLTNKSLIHSPIPLISVPTLASSGSEWNEHFVISRRETGEKLTSSNKALYFKLSILDPRYTLTAPKSETANGLFDSFAHVNEQYVTGQLSPVQDRLSEALLCSITEVSPKLMTDLYNLNHRATAMLASSLALNGIISLGSASCWASHAIGHSLTAKYGIDHAQTIAIVMPWVWRHFFDMKRYKLAQMAERVWNAKTGSSVDELALFSITKTEEFAKELGFKKFISQIVVEPNQKEAINDLVERVFKASHGLPIGENGSVKKEDVKEILEAAF